ncbi:hypothetical protein DEM27_25505 [Metarhizobium album]|uniref:Uncharacterized protein n=1 Tax=Metarhizobium album TaxID=2182425 RepID=A0A2U2DK11_9HYPH|nr:hypothetical protein DEM27_25505 [Rhizobium album]
MMPASAKVSMVDLDPVELIWMVMALKEDPGGPPASSTLSGAFANCAKQALDPRSVLIDKSQALPAIPAGTHGRHLR